MPVCSGVEVTPAIERASLDANETTMSGVAAIRSSALAPVTDNPDSTNQSRLIFP